MDERFLTYEHIRSFSEYLCSEEKSVATREKYLRDVRRFKEDAGTAPVTKELLASVNSLLRMLGWEDCRVKNIRFQRQIYCTEEKELTKAEYLRLLEVSQKDVRLNLILQTICGTGIRVSELRFFTVEAIRTGRITVDCKNKIRTILL